MAVMEGITNTLPRIAVLGGTGKEGPGLAMRWAYAGYPVIIGSRLEEKAGNTASELNAALGIDTIIGLQNNHAAREADILSGKVKSKIVTSPLIPILKETIP